MRFFHGLLPISAVYCLPEPGELIGRLPAESDHLASEMYCSDKADGPTAGSETVDPLEFLARVLTHIPDKGQVTQRYYGWYANRTRGVRRRQAAPTDATSTDATAEATVVVVPARPLSRTEAAHRWAEVLRQIFEVDPLVCPACGGAMRIVACMTLPAVIDRILTHLRTRALSLPTAVAPHPRHAPGARGVLGWLPNTRSGPRAR